MSGGPPHHSHGRAAPPPANPPWNHLQVPNFFPSRQPQHAHMSNEPSLLQQPTWHTPTATEPPTAIKMPPSHIFSLEQMLSDRQFSRSTPPGVDLTLQRNGNGDLSAAPISLSVRDTNKINSLAASALDDLKPLSPAPRRPPKRVDSILERLNTTLAEPKTPDCEPKSPKSVIVTASSSHDENSNSSSTVPVTTRDDDVISPFSNDDNSLDSNKSRRKRKPSKTVRLAAAAKDEAAPALPPAGAKSPDKADESETIDNIAAMVQDGLHSNSSPAPSSEHNNETSVIKATNELSNGSNNVTTSKEPPFVEVEDKLEEMFAGIGEIKAGTSQVTSTSSELVKVKKITKKKGKRKRILGEMCTPKGRKMAKKALKVGKSPKCKKIDEIKDVYAYDSGSNASSSKSRGPFIQIRGPRDSPLSVAVVNTPTNDDEHVKSSKSKKFHDDSEYRHKVRSKGLHCSTLSHKYDAQTKDASWICAFCKKGPHSGGAAPGDLFGPYFITTNSAEYERRLDDPFDGQFKSKKIARMLEGGVVGKKAKRKMSVEDDIYVGITATGRGTYEIWAHEECVVWSAGIYLIGPKIVGLEEAVWSSCNVCCGRCGAKGANICCLKRGCVQVAHVSCARLMNWEFDEACYKTFCPEHRVVAIN